MKTEITKCPSCLFENRFVLADDTTGSLREVKGARLAAGEFAVCGGCDLIIRFDDALEPKRASEKDIDQLGEEEMATLMKQALLTAAGRAARELEEKKSAERELEEIFLKFAPELDGKHEALVRFLREHYPGPKQALLALCAARVHVEIQQFCSGDSGLTRDQARFVGDTVQALAYKIVQLENKGRA